jgi:uncharacterized protein YjcR
MANWNSSTKTYSNVVKEETKEKETMAKKLYSRSFTVKEIAQRMGLSESRIREYLRA